MHGGGDKQVVWGQIKTGTKFFKGNDSWCGLASGNGTKITGADGALLGTALIAEMINVSQLEDIGGKIV